MRILGSILVIGLVMPANGSGAAGQGQVKAA
jgi:hypothetical protein